MVITRNSSRNSELKWSHWSSDQNLGSIVTRNNNYILRKNAVASPTADWVQALSPVDRKLYVNLMTFSRYFFPFYFCIVHLPWVSYNIISFLKQPVSAFYCSAPCLFMCTYFPLLFLFFMRIRSPLEYLNHTAGGFFGAGHCRVNIIV